MSKENMKRFLEKAAANPAQGKKLSNLKEEYGKAVPALACEAGFEVTCENLSEKPQCLDDEEMETVVGGWNPFPFGKGLKE